MPQYFIVDNRSDIKFTEGDSGYSLQASRHVTSYSPFLAYELDS